MSRTALGLAGLFIALALWQGLSVFASDDEPAPVTPPPSPTASATPTPTPTPSPSAVTEFPTFEGPRPDPRPYDATEELVADLSAKGIECTSLNYLDEEDPTLEEFSLCDPGSEESRFNIYLYPAAPNRKLWVNNMRSQKLPLPLVWGPNWIVVGAGDPGTAMKRIRSIAGAIGGKIEDFSPKK